MSDTKKKVVVIVGGGDMGLAIARRIGGGHVVLLANINDERGANEAQTLRDEGFVVETAHVDISNRESVAALAEQATSLGDIWRVVCTAGLSPVQASVEAILAVDLVGTAIVLEEFGKVIANNGAGVIVASMAGHMLPPLDVETEKNLATTPPDELLKLEALDRQHIPNSGAAYSLAKRANIIRVQAESIQWAAHGARLNSISPGIILTQLAREEMAGPSATSFDYMTTSSPAGRVGTTDEIAEAAAYLLDAAFVTGTDLLIDGGVIAAVKAGRINLQQN